MLKAVEAGSVFRPPSRTEISDATYQAWGSHDEGHLLLVKIEGNRLEATPYGNLDGNRLRAIQVNDISSGAPADAKKTSWMKPR